MRVGVENVRRAMRAALLVADHYQLERIAAPAMGFGEAGVSHDEAARAMIDECTGFKSAYPQLVAIVTSDEEMYDALKSYSEGR
jgi:O-acetyl-ADP-ribose deacetylase (regulator of RNase III)